MFSRAHVDVNTRSQGIAPARPHTAAEPGSFFARDNLVRFLRWCIGLGVPSIRLFEVSPACFAAALPAAALSLGQINIYPPPPPTHTHTQTNTSPRSPCTERARAREDSSCASVMCSDNASSSHLAHAHVRTPSQLPQPLTLTLQPCS
jgi:hypothetical protein